MRTNDSSLASPRTEKTKQRTASSDATSPSLLAIGNQWLDRMSGPRLDLDFHFRNIHGVNSKNKADLQQGLREAIAILSLSMPEDELANGWTKESLSAMAKSFTDLNARLEANRVTEKDLTLNYPRGLDYWGVHGGSVYALAMRIHHALRQFLEGLNTRG